MDERKLEIKKTNFGSLMCCDLCGVNGFVEVQIGERNFVCPACMEQLTGYWLQHRPTPGRVTTDNWSRKEPEIGAVARVMYLNREYLCQCVIGDNSRKWWTNRTGFVVEWDVPFHWVFVATPEEERMRKSVEELEGKLLVIRNAIINAPMVLTNSGILHRWSDDLVKSIDTQKGNLPEGVRGDSQRVN